VPSVAEHDRSVWNRAEARLKRAVRGACHQSVTMCAGVVLADGRSSRMSTAAKAALEWRRVRPACDGRAERRPAHRDRAVPLGAGDTVLFLPADADG